MPPTGIKDNKRWPWPRIRRTSYWPSALSSLRDREFHQAREEVQCVLVAELAGNLIVGAGGRLAKRQRSGLDNIAYFQSSAAGSV
jgi:hypothetical protein